MREPDAVLATERVRLRRFTHDDVALLHGLDADPEVMAYLTGGKSTSWEEIETRRLPGYLAGYESHGLGHWAAEKLAAEKFAAEQLTTEELPDGGFIGWFALEPGDRGLELGYRLRRDAWGKGYASEVSIALVDAAFTRFGADRVYAETMAVNRRSRRVMEAAGLRYDRTFHLTFDDPIPGTEHGEVEYALTREQWRAERSGQAGHRPV